MTTQLSIYGTDADLALIECSKGDKPFNFGDKPLYVKLASLVSVQPGDKVLVVVHGVFDASEAEARGYEADESFMSKLEFTPQVEIFTIAEDEEASSEGCFGTTQGSWWSPENCFKILNPEVLAQ